MREVNEAFVLPNPPSWFKVASQGVEKMITGLKQMIIPPEKELIRVSWSDQFAAASALVN